MRQDKILTALYTALADKELCGLLNGDLTLTRHYEGRLYGSTDLKLMAVGRAVNGWENDIDAFTDAKQIAEQALSVPFDFHCLVEKNDSGSQKYNFRKSPFWQLLKRILEVYGESERNEWYNDEQQWYDKILWSNLYKISPAAGGNPNQQLQRETYEICSDILAREIALYQPAHILFITGRDWFYYPEWPEYFSAKLAFQGEFVDSKYIIASGKINNIPTVVCRRPESLSRSELSLAVKDCFERII